MTGYPGMLHGSSNLPIIAKIKMKKLLMKPFLIEQVRLDKKTQTRRIGGLEKVNENSLRHNWDNFSSPKSRFKVGEIVYVPESYIYVLFEKDYDLLEGMKSKQIFQNDVHSDFRDVAKDRGFTWKNPMFIPESEARLFLEITDVRVELISDISENDAIAEGIEIDERMFSEHKEPYITIYGDHYGHWYSSPQKAFFSLLNKVNKKKIDLDSFVWVYEFKIHKDLKK